MRYGFAGDWVDVEMEEKIYRCYLNGTRDCEGLFTEDIRRFRPLTFYFGRIDEFWELHAAKRIYRANEREEKEFRLYIAKEKL